MKKSPLQKGFTLVEALLMILIIVIVAFAGYYVYHAQKTVNNTYSTAAKDASGSPKFTSKKGNTTTASARSLKVTEWGVEASYSGDMTLTYSFKHDTGDVTYIALTSDKLNAADSRCASDPTYGGVIERYTANEDILSEDGQDVSHMTASDYASSLASSTYGHVGNYYFFYSHPQADCATTTAGQAVMTTAQDLVKSLLPKFVASN